MRISDWSSDVCSSDLCCDVCPTGASLFGPVALLQVEAERRLATEPGTTLRFARGDIRDDRPDHEAATAHYAKPVYGRSEERRVGNECVRPCRSRGSPYP